MAPYPPWSPTVPPNSCMDCWMLLAGDGYCRYELERTKVDCDCVRNNKGATGSKGLGRSGQRLEDDGRWVRCRDCDGKTYFYVTKVTYQCPGDVAGGKIRKHREIHKRFWADEREPMTGIKPWQFG